jgi:hypothetical protein
MAPVPWMNGSLKFINLFYTDYVEYSRSIDVCFMRNDCAWK